MGIAAGWVPWLIYLDRTIFTFYSVAFVPFLVLALAMMLGTWLGPADASARRRTAATRPLGFAIFCPSTNTGYAVAAVPLRTTICELACISPSTIFSASLVSLLLGMFLVNVLEPGVGLKLTADVSAAGELATSQHQ